MTSYAEEVANQLTSQPLQLKVEGRLGLPADEAFTYLTDANRLYEWIPLAKRTWSDDSKAEVPQGVGSVRMLDTGLGSPTREKVLFKEEPRAYAYSANNAALMGMYRDHVGVITVEPDSESSCKVEWLTYAKPTPLSMLGKRLLNLMLGKGMRELERKFPL